MKILAYNISDGGDARLSLIAALIRQQRPDAVALLEANSRANAEWLAWELGMQFAFGEAHCACHVAWLSYLPIRRRANHRHAALAKTLLEIEVSWEGEATYLFATHLASRHEPPEPVDEVPIILGLLAPLGARPHLLVGDLNAFRPGDPVGIPPVGVVPRGDATGDTPRRAIGQLLDAGYLDCYRALHPDTPGYTYPAVAPWLRLDYVFAAPQLAERLAACNIVTGSEAAQASDHLPVWAVFRAPVH